MIKRLIPRECADCFTLFPRDRLRRCSRSNCKNLICDDCAAIHTACAMCLYKEAEEAKNASNEAPASTAAAV